MTDKYKDLRDALASVKFVERNGRTLTVVPQETWDDAANPETIRALLAERDELERALTLSGKVNKRLMDELADLVAERDRFFFALQEISHPEAVRGDATNIARYALAQEQGD